MFKLSIKPLWPVLIIWVALAGIGIKLAQAITGVTPLSQPVGYVAQDALTSYNLTSGNEIVYRGQYEREYWGGNLIAYAVNSAGDIATATQPWNGGAAYQIALQGSNRRIATLKDNGTKIPFAWASLSGAQQTAIGSSTVLDYLRGVRSNEVQQGGTLRQRASPLGDIVHSRPLYLSDSTAPTVFIGANDGMLHAIDASSGAERWAYVPSMLIPKLKNLATPASSPFVHDYYVDGSMVAGNILSNSKRVLVGALGAGGKGLYALDITGSARLAAATESAVADNILWEITPTSINNVANAAYANLGYTYANPSLVKVAGTDVVLVGNGFNNGGDYQAYLYVINANTGALIAAIQAGTSGSSGSPNGLSTAVAVDSNHDGSADIAYAGDLNGKLWKFDLTAATASVLFTTNPLRPITMTPGVSAHPNGGYMVNFATGAVLRAADLTDTATESAYGIWDGAPAANAVLLTQTLTERCFTAGTAATPTPCATRVRTVTANQPVWSAGATHHKGWKVDLPASEKVVGDGSFIENSRFYFTSYNPTVATTVQASIVMGENWLMELDYLSGGVQNSPFLDLSADHLITDDDRVKDSATPRAPVLTSDGVAVGKFIGIGVTSQPVLVQLSTLNNTLFNQNPDVTVVPVVLGTGAGVSGGHFDEDIYYGGASTSSAGKAAGSVTFTYASSGTSKTVSNLVITANGETLYSGSPGSKKPKKLDDFLDGKSSANYEMVKDYNGDDTTVGILAKSTGTAYNGPVTVLITTTGSSPGYTKVDLTGGVDSVATGGDTCVGAACQSKQHFHQYDDKFDVTGVNMLNPSSVTLILSNGIASLTRNFKVIVSNQYLNPAVKLHIGDASYLYNVNFGYTDLRTYQTAATLDLATLQTYRRDPATVWPGAASTDAEKLAQPKFIGSLAINMPLDALTAKDWWGNGDIRVGLHPTQTGCVKKAAGATDGNMYQPVIPPADHSINNGRGSNGYNGSTTAATATGVRHNGALVIQIISDTTPNAALELNVPGHPEYGWRVKSSLYSTYVLTEYTTFWHHPNGYCYGEVGWTKAPGADNGSSSLQPKAAGSTDPKIGDLSAVGSGGGGTITNVTTTVVGAVTTTTITYSDGSTARIVRTVNADGSVTIVTTDALGTVTTQTIANTEGSLGTGGDERGAGAVRTGRISWRELVSP